MAPCRKLIYSILILIFLLPLPFSARIFRAIDEQRRASSSKPSGYAYGDQIPLFANKVFGADERCDADSYFSLPFCPPGEKLHKRKKSLNEILAGDCLTNTQYELRFGVPVSEGFLCDKYMTEDDLKRFKTAIENKFEYQMYFADIWFGSKVGEAIEETGLGKKYYLFNHIEFNLDFMEDQVKGVNIVNSLDSSVAITNITETPVEFSYSVVWNEIKPTNNSNYFKSRYKAPYGKASWVLEENRGLFWSGIWLWTTISFWWVALPLVVASPYLFRYVMSNRQPHQGSRFNDKVCQCPMFTSLLGALLGVGTQHLIIMVLLFVSAYQGIYPCNRERISVDIVLAYCLTSVPSAFIGRSFHEKFSPLKLKECVFLTGALYFYPAFIAVLLAKIFVSNSLMVNDAIYILSIAGIGSAILVYLCCIATRKWYEPEHDVTACATRMVDVFNPPASSLWYMKTPAQMVLVGLSIFLPICLVMDDIYASLWGLKACGSFFTLFTVFSMVIITTIISAYALTGVQLLKNDYNWWWRSVLRGGSPAILMFVYGIYFLSKIKTESDREFLPLLVYNCCICYSLFLVLGSVSFRASHFAFRFYMAVVAKKRS
ncbi:transmembrane 9 superfamily member 5-like isoform X1 [Cucurbita maxima]|uniref:Transmembrane 9 superfamily member n=1 Tax=Cucurbita maxima TaxID=3661 RepID=A0A6J1IAJ2_CUCMA|nr:transmembrane 9 superfamily member 5-like isoform X1 [Cucurbita maxima]